MKLDEDGNDFVLSSGKKFYAHAGLLSPWDEGRLCYGYDSVVDTDDFTPEERAEIAEYMIAEWTKWKDWKG